MIAFATEGNMLTFGNVFCGIGMAARGVRPNLRLLVEVLLPALPAPGARRP